MRRVVILVAALAWTLSAFAQEANYTLVLGFSVPRQNAPGYHEYAQKCAPDLACCTYTQLEYDFGCDSFATCIRSMMKGARHIIFLVDGPNGDLQFEDALPSVEPGDGSLGTRTRFELWLITHCADLYSKTLWRRYDDSEVTMRRSETDVSCPN